MKQGLLITGLLLLVGCTGVKEYSQVLAHPAPANLTGYWQSVGPQSELVSPDAQATLVVMPDGETLDCRQWQRVIAVPGKLTPHEKHDGWLNITEQGDVYTLRLQHDQLKYAGMMLQRVTQISQECAQALQMTAEKPPLP